MTCSCGKASEPGRDECFRCRVHMYGRQNFAERTNAEYVAEHIGDVNRPGIAHMGSQEWQG